jgi:hypothetical protein
MQPTSAGIADVRSMLVVEYGVDEPAERAPRFAIDTFILMRSWREMLRRCY